MYEENWPNLAGSEGRPSGVERGKVTSRRALNARLRLETCLVEWKVPWLGGKVTC